LRPLPMAAVESAPSAATKVAFSSPVARGVTLSRSSLASRLAVPRVSAVSR
jgi:hypothetical protein